MSMRVLIADDEDLARHSLRRALAAFSDIEVIRECANGLQAVEAIPALRPDVVFLDVEMPGLNGFEVLQQLADPPATVFVTAFDEYAVKAFETDALDYILKPIEADRLERAITRLRDRLAGRASSGPRLEAAVKRAGPIRRLAAKRGNRFVIVPLKDIVRVAIEDKLVFAHSEKERFLVERTISDLETLLEPSGFLRISRGELVNVEMVRELIPWFSGTWRVRLAGGGEHDVSRERAKRLREVMGVL
jgi:two-component system LytT family response regulator